jgi:hypothetical protein
MYHRAAGSVLMCTSYEAYTTALLLMAYPLRCDRHMHHPVALTSIHHSYDIMFLLCIVLYFILIETYCVAKLLSCFCHGRSTTGCDHTDVCVCVCVCVQSYT